MPLFGDFLAVDPFTLVVAYKSWLILVVFRVELYLSPHCNRVDPYCNNLAHYHFNQCLKNFSLTAETPVQVVLVKARSTLVSALGQWRQESHQIRYPGMGSRIQSLKKTWETGTREEAVPSPHGWSSTFIHAATLTKILNMTSPNLEEAVSGNSVWKGKEPELGGGDPAVDRGRYAG